MIHRRKLHRRVGRVKHTAKSFGAGACRPGPGRHGPALSAFHAPDEDASRRAGTALVLTALMLPVIAGIVAFSVDMGLMTALRSQIQNAVDSGALAASLQLQEEPDDFEAAAAAARRYIQLNRVGMAVTVPENAIAVETGEWDPDTQTFTTPSSQPNAVRVFARQDDEPFFFGRVFGRETFGAPASAIATGSGSQLDIMMVVDLSGSMKTHGRINALRHSAPVFVDVMEEYGGDDQIGVMGLSADPSQYDPLRSRHYGTLYDSGLHPTDDHHVGVLESELTKDFDHLRNNVLGESNLEAGKYGKSSGGGAGGDDDTGTGAALGDAAHYLAYGSDSRRRADKAIVLMSDGYATKPSKSGAAYARQMARYAARQEITVHTISLGNSADVDLMEEIAALTGGIHVDATGSGWGTLTEQLTKAYNNIAAEIKRTRLVK